MSDKKYDFSDFDTPAKTESTYDFSDFDAPQKEDPSILSTAVGKGLEGVTMGLSDRLQGIVASGLRAAGLKNTGGNIQDIELATPTLDTEELAAEYYKTRDLSRDKSAEQSEANPKTALLSELVGGFATPGFAVAKSLGAGAKGIQGVMQAAKAGATAGATAGAISTAAQEKELENLKATDVLKGAGVGAGVGAVLGGASKGVGNLVDYAGASEVGQKIGKIFNKSKEGADLVSKEAPELFNKELLKTSDDIVNAVTNQANDFKAEYGKAVKRLKIDAPEKFQADLDKLADELADQQVRGGMIDVRTVDATINKLRDDMNISDDKIRQLKDSIFKAAKTKKEMSSTFGYKKAEQGVSAVDTATENLAQKKALDNELFQIKEDLLLLKEQKALTSSAAERAEITDLMRQKVKDKFYKEKELKDLGYEITESKLATSKTSKNEGIVDKSSRDILTQVDPVQDQINSLQQGKIEASKRITDLVEQKQATNNSAFSGLLNQVDILKNSAPNTNLATIKDVNLNSLKSYAEQMGRPDLVAKIDGIVKSNIKGAPELDSKYRDMMAGLKELGIGLDESASNVLKTQDAGTYLTQQLKQAAKNETGDAANKLQASQNVLNNPQVNDLLTKGKSIGENYNLARDISQSNIKSIGYRGAAAAGQAAGAVANSKLVKAASKLGNSSLGKKVQDVMSMPEGDVKNRAIFLLNQQGWFRSVSEEDKK